MNIYILATLTAVFSFQFQHPELVATTNKVSPFSCSAGSQVPPSVTRQIKWTRQLPRLVRNAFNKSYYANWYIEKMIQYNSGSKTVYRFYLDNGSLLDGDHHDCFLQFFALDIAEDGVVLTR